MESSARHGWEAIGDLLEGRASTSAQGELGQPLSEPSRPHWAQVDLRGVRVERVRDFGQVYLALSLWRRLGLHTMLGQLIESGREEVPWELTACILTLARFCGQKSELEVAERWYADSALEDLLGVPFCQINKLNCSTKRIGRKCRPGSKLNWCPIPMAVRANSIFFAVPAPAGRRKRR